MAWSRARLEVEKTCFVLIVCVSSDLRQREHQREGMLGGGNRVAAGGVHHHHAVVGGGSAVDVVHAHAGAAEHLEVLGGGENLGRDLRLGADDQAVVITDDFEQLFRFEAGVHIHRNARGVAQGVHTFFRDRVRNQHALAYHRGWCLNDQPPAGKARAGKMAPMAVVVAGDCSTAACAPAEPACHFLRRV